MAVYAAVKTIAAARAGDVDGLRRLKGSGVDVDAKDTLGWTALHRASMHWQLESMRCLVLELGAAVDSRDEDGWTAVHRAAWSGQLDSLRCLVLELGADVHAGCDAHGESAIHVAARNGQIDALRCLVTELDVDLETCDKWGRSAVHFAAWEGSVDVLRSLKLIANLNEREAHILVAKDVDGKMPVDYADDQQMHEASEWLRTHSYVASALLARRREAPETHAALLAHRASSRSDETYLEAFPDGRIPDPPSPLPAVPPVVPPLVPAPPVPTGAPLSPKERSRAEAIAARLVDELQLVEDKARSLAAHLVGVHGATAFDELLDPFIFEDLDVLAPHGLLPVPKKKLRKLQLAWVARGPDDLSRELETLKREIKSQRQEHETLIKAEVASATKLADYQSRVADLESSVRSLSPRRDHRERRHFPDPGKVGSPTDGDRRPIWRPVGI